MGFAKFVVVFYLGCFAAYGKDFIFLLYNYTHRNYTLFIYLSIYFLFIYIPIYLFIYLLIYILYLFIYLISFLFFFVNGFFY